MNARRRRTLDTRGGLCPQPILDLATEMGRMDVGEEIEVLSDDPAFPFDVRAWCAGTGHELLEQREEAGLYRARILRRTGR